MADGVRASDLTGSCSLSKKKLQRPWHKNGDIPVNGEWSVLRTVDTDSTVTSANSQRMFSPLAIQPLLQTRQINRLQFEVPLARVGEDNFLHFQNLISCSGVVAETRPLRLSRLATCWRFVHPLRVDAEANCSRCSHRTHEATTSRRPNAPA